ncbi:MAG: hypothetical protein QOH36_1464 [Actinomycetota bacterium]|nr:hypothetical protein [Actinomycetota bacterium]
MSYRRCARGERGSVVPLMALAIVVLGAAVLLVGRLGVAATDRAGARTAADAAALAGAAEGEGPAGDLAAANGADMTNFAAEGTDARVEVELGTARAVARARRSHGAVDGVDRGALDDERLAPAMRAALGRAGQLLRHEFPITHVHPSGLAVEVPAAVADRLAGVAPSAGLCRPDPDARPTLFEVCQAGDGGP